MKPTFILRATSSLIKIKVLRRDPASQKIKLGNRRLTDFFFKGKINKSELKKIVKDKKKKRMKGKTKKVRKGSVPTLPY